MSILDYLTSSLEKPGRAFRGLLSGNAREGLAAVPFSDSMDWTDEAEKVSGSDLLKQLGMDPGDGIGGTLAGVGVDVATDPLTYMGGALAKRLLGGGFRTVGKTAADLVPEEFDLGNRYARMANGSFPGETGAMPKAVPGPMPGEVMPAGESGPLLQHLLPGADAPMPAGEVIRGLPHPDSYSHLIGFGPDWGGKLESPINDMLADGLKHDAFKAGIGNWGQVLGDLGRLDSEGRAALGLEKYGVPTETGRAWRSLLDNRNGDLTAAYRLRDAVPGFEHLEPMIQEQLAAIKRLHPNGQEYSSANHAASDVLMGHYRPSEVIGDTRDYLGHMPVNPDELRRLAAYGQQESVGSGFRDHLGFLTDSGEIPVSQLDNHHEPAYLVKQLEHLFNPAAADYHRIEPNILHKMLAGPHGEGTDIGEAKALLDRLRGTVSTDDLARMAGLLQWTRV